MMTNPTCHAIENTVDSKRIDDLTLEIDSAAGLCNDCEKKAMISGSTAGNWLVNNGWIGIGMRVEVWFGDKFVITSPVRSIRVEAHSPSERELEAGSATV